MEDANFACPNGQKSNKIDVDENKDDVNLKPETSLHSEFNDQSLSDSQDGKSKT